MNGLLGNAIQPLICMKMESSQFLKLIVVEKLINVTHCRIDAVLYHCNVVSAYFWYISFRASPSDLFTRHVLSFMRVY